MQPQVTVQPARPLRLILLRYTLRNGARGTLHCIASSTSAALVQLLDQFGADVRCCSAAVA